MSTLLISRFPVQGRVTRASATRARLDGGSFRPALLAFFPLPTGTQGTPLQTSGSLNRVVRSTSSGPNTATRVGAGSNAAVKNG